MSEEEKPGRYDCDRLKDEFFKDIDYFTREYQLTYAEVVGVLECVKFQIILESKGLSE